MPRTLIHTVQNFHNIQKNDRKNIENGLFLVKITGLPSKGKGEHYQIFGVTRRVTRLAKWGPGFGGECELFCSFAQILPPPPWPLLTRKRPTCVWSKGTFPVNYSVASFAKLGQKPALNAGNPLKTKILLFIHGVFSTWRKKRMNGSWTFLIRMVCCSFGVWMRLCANLCTRTYLTEFPS